MKRLKFLIALIVLLITPLVCDAQQGMRLPPPTHPCNGPHPPQWCNTGTPIDGGVWWILLLGGIWGGYKILKRSMLKKTMTV